MDAYIDEEEVFHEAQTENDAVTLPDNFFPQCWDNDERMYFLLAPFRPKALNPISYESKLIFWRNLIRKYCEAKGSAQVSLPELISAFMRKGKKPHALETVLSEMEAEREIVKMGKFMEAQQPWRDWAHRSMYNVISWPIYHIKSRLWSSSGEETTDQPQGCPLVLQSAVKV